MSLEMKSLNSLIQIITNRGGDMTFYEWYSNNCDNASSYEDCWNAAIESTKQKDCTQCVNWDVARGIPTVPCLGCVRCTHNSDLFNRRKEVTDDN